MIADDFRAIGDRLQQLRIESSWTALMKVFEQRYQNVRLVDFEKGCPAETVTNPAPGETT